mmetsp:Transcript_27040/g.79158  ORF Transcript_27040/g.79158 Transcript_27040/m.79158 type:complete len:214 (+) Transcript_27040:981-1622(+)
MHWSNSTLFALRVLPGPTITQPPPPLASLEFAHPALSVSAESVSVPRLVTTKARERKPASMTWLPSPARVTSMPSIRTAAPSRWNLEEPLRATRSVRCGCLAWRAMLWRISLTLEATTQVSSSASAATSAATSAAASASVAVSADAAAAAAASAAAAAAFALLPSSSAAISTLSSFAGEGLGGGGGEGGAGGANGVPYNVQSFITADTTPEET